MNKANAVSLLEDVVSGRVDAMSLLDRERTTGACITAGYLVWNEYNEPIVTDSGKAFVAAQKAARRSASRARYGALRAAGMRRSADGWE